MAYKSRSKSRAFEYDPSPPSHLKLQALSLLLMSIIGQSVTKESMKAINWEVWMVFFMAGGCVFNGNRRTTDERRIGVASIFISFLFPSSFCFLVSDLCLGFLIGFLFSHLYWVQSYKFSNLGCFHAIIQVKQDF